MHADDLKQFAVRLMAVSELLEQRSERAVLQVEQGAVQLGQVAHGLDLSGQRLSSEVLDVVRAQSSVALEHGLAAALAQCQARFRQAADSASQAARQWDEASRRLHREQRRLRWTGWIALLLGSLLTAGGSGWLAARHLRQLEQARFGEDILAATRSGAITRCGERLCARVGTRPQRYGARGEYVLVER